MAPERPLKVLYLMHTAARGGAASSLRYLLEHFPPGTVQPSVLSVDGPVADALRESGIAVRRIPGVSMFHSFAGIPLRGPRLLELFRTVWFMRYGRIIRRVIADIRPDLVHLNDRGMLHAARIASRAGVPVLMHARSVADPGTRWVRRISRALTARYVDRVIAIDQSVRHSLRDLPRVEVVYNPLAASPAPSRAETGGSPPFVRVTYLTGLLEFKGIWDLLSAARMLREREEIQFLIAGTNSRSPEFHRSLRGRLAHVFGFAPDVETAVREWRVREGLESTVQLLGHVDRVDELLAQTDILAFPSHLNAPGRSVFEAGVQGIPAIVAMRDRIEDVVVDGETGLIVPERDPPSLARAIVRLADDPGLRQRLGRNAQSRYTSQFEPTAVAQQVLQLYRTVLGARSQGSSWPAAEPLCLSAPRTEPDP